VRQVVYELQSLAIVIARLNRKSIRICYGVLVPFARARKGVEGHSAYDVMQESGRSSGCIINAIEVDGENTHWLCEYDQDVCVASLFSIYAVGPSP